MFKHPFKVQLNNQPFLRLSSSLSTQVILIFLFFYFSGQLLSMDKSLLPSNKIEPDSLSSSNKSLSEFLPPVMIGDVSYPVLEDVIDSQLSPLIDPLKMEQVNIRIVIYFK